MSNIIALNGLRILNVRIEKKILQFIASQSMAKVAQRGHSRLLGCPFINTKYNTVTSHRIRVV